jgi:ParB-like chromosome segregation protein Spo0J
MNLARVALAWVFLGCVATPAWAQHIYKYRMPDGTIMYTDSRSGFSDQYIQGKLEETLTEPAPARDHVDAAMRAHRDARNLNARDAQKAQEGGVDAAYAMMVEARQALQNAEQALQVGLEPLPGERLGLVNGHSRLSPAYWARVDKLRQDVEAARDRLDRAANALVQAR